MLTGEIIPCRAAMPVVTAAVAVFVERKVPSRAEVIALLLLVSGVIISVFEGQASGSSYGITLSITGKPCTQCTFLRPSRFMCAWRHPIMCWERACSCSRHVLGSPCSSHGPRTSYPQILTWHGGEGERLLCRGAVCCSNDVHCGEGAERGDGAAAAMM